MITVICVWSGKKYSSDYVKQLSWSLAEHLDLSYRFICFTDHKIIPALDGVEFCQLPKLPFDLTNPWWYKIWLFSSDSGLSGRILYLDLDVMIIKNITKFPEHTGDFLGIRDYTRTQNPGVKITNSSIMCWEHENYQFLWKKFAENSQEIQKIYAGDQNYITNELADGIIWWPDSWTRSYRWEYLKTGIQPETAVIVFHGRPKPHEISWKLFLG